MNGLHKLDAATFAVWMPILARVPRSVLWLPDEGSPTARANLAREAVRQGIDASRLHFAPRAPLPHYLARYKVADLFLDTFAYNAGATAVGRCARGCRSSRCAADCCRLATAIRSSTWRASLASSRRPTGRPGATSSAASAPAGSGSWSPPRPSRRAAALAATPASRVEATQEGVGESVCERRRFGRRGARPFRVSIFRKQSRMSPADTSRSLRRLGIVTLRSPAVLRGRLACSCWAF